MPFATVVRKHRASAGYGVILPVLMGIDLQKVRAIIKYAAASANTEPSINNNIVYRTLKTWSARASTFFFSFLRKNTKTWCKSIPKTWFTVGKCSLTWCRTKKCQRSRAKKMERCAVSDVTPPISSALPERVIKILKALLHNQCAHFIWQPLFFFFFSSLSMRSPDIWAFIVAHQSLLLVHLPYTHTHTLKKTQKKTCVFFEQDTPHNLHPASPFFF